MKKIIFTRHAKSSWDYEVSDIDRPLKMRGIQDAYLIGDRLKKENYHPNLVFSSPANRAMHTALIMLRQMAISPSTLKIDANLYDFEGSSLITTIKSLPNEADTAMLFGHNYAMTSVVNMLGDKFIDNVTTAGVVVINFASSNWENIPEEKGVTELVLFPKQLK
ncbi:SixA phosphatase family protein [Spongiivirga citrea]|uniref:Histidine phosphatase family protein n=1 Tax=Spongiivirga citrea TaxID=1481457 RepID=A0A6M0CP56_9FLAO|nr:histidine phosphatase family protein [Spongiivirga citrea]NER17649.1 histidine phosphatase family protein [Spongiivirga citrea]